MGMACLLGPVGQFGVLGSDYRASKAAGEEVERLPRGALCLRIPRALGLGVYQMAFCTPQWVFD